jgi:hypothetical protein
MDTCPSIEPLVLLTFPIKQVQRSSLGYIR